MENYKVYLSNNETIDIKCDNCTFNTETNELYTVIDNKVAFTIKPKSVGIRKTVEEPIVSCVVIPH